MLTLQRTENCRQQPGAGGLMPAGKKTHKEHGAGREPSGLSRREPMERKCGGCPEISPDLRTQSAEELISELQEHKIELEAQTEELQRIQQALEESHHELLDLYDSAPIGYLTLCDRSKISRVNLTMAGYLGEERKKLVGSRFTQYIVPEDLHVWDDFFMRVMNAQKTSAATLMLKRKDNSCFPARVEGLQLLNPARGKPTIRVAVSEITDIRRAEQSLRESENLLKTVIQLLPVGVIILGPGGEILARNPEAGRIWGQTLPPANGRPAEFRCRKLEDGARIEAADCAGIRAITKGETTLEEQIEIECPDGEQKVVLNSAIPLEKSNGKIPGAVVVTQDITEGKAAEEEIRWLASYPELNPNPVIEIDAGGTITFANPASRITLHKLGFPSDPSLFVPGDLEEILRLLERDTGVQVEREITVGDETFLENIAIEPGLQVARIYARDITDRKQMESALKESEERFRHIFTRSVVGKSITYPDGRMEANRAFSDMLGYTEEEFRKVTWQEITHPDDLTESRQLAKSLLSGEKESGRFIKRYLHKNGSVVWADVSTTVERDRDGRPRYLMVTISDITGIRQAEVAVRLANKKLTLLSSITRHDIKNQIQTAQGFLELLHTKVADPALEDYLTKVTRAVFRISSMIQSAKEYEQIGVNAPVWHDCRALVDAAVKEARPGQITMKNDLPAGLEVFADPLIFKVCFNLVDNALRHGGTITTIRFSQKESGNDRIVICEDDGDGVALKEKEKIFERGYGKNTGLGLALSREILDITGITIKETGEPGRGARFEIRVPGGMWRIAPANKKS